MYLLDSSAIIEVGKNTAVGRKIVDRIGNDLAVTSAICLYEFLAGYFQLNNAQLKLITKHVDILPFDTQSAEQSATIRKRLKKIGKMINKLDILIAGTCIAQNATLITLDHDYERITELKTKTIF